MKFRLSAFGLHLLTSAVILGIIVGGLYAGWYRGPAWYLSGVSKTVLLIGGVDVVLGPLLTFIIAAPSKPRRELMRDLAVIAAVQVFALSYGAHMLWRGRPVYYAYSQCCLTLVQHYDLDPSDTALAVQRNLPLAPHWYSLPQWVWAPLPPGVSVMSGDYDITGMPTHYRPWSEGLPALRKQLVTLEETGFFLPHEKRVIKRGMEGAGLPLDQKNVLPFTGRGRPLLAVFEPSSGVLLRSFEPK